MSLARAIKRNKVRIIVKKNKNIKSFWRKLMIKKHGEIEYINILNRTT